MTKTRPTRRPIANTSRDKRLTEMNKLKTTPGRCVNHNQIRYSQEGINLILTCDCGFTSTTKLIAGISTHIDALYDLNDLHV